MYQTTEFTKFLWGGVWRVLVLWQFVSLWVCVLLAYVGGPVSAIEERLQIGDVKADRSNDSIDDGFGEREKSRKNLHGNGRKR